MTQAAAKPGAEPQDLLDEVARRGTELYETRLRATLEREHPGELVAIHPDSGTFAGASDEEEALRRLWAQHPEGLVFLRRIGPPTPADIRLAARLTSGLRDK